MVSPAGSVHKMYEARLREMYPGDVFETMIPHSVDYLEAIISAKPVAAATSPRAPPPRR